MKEYRNENCRKRVSLRPFAGVLLLLFLCMTGCFFCRSHVQAASANKIVFTDGSGSYLVYKSKNWYLKDADGKALTGIQYLTVKKSSSFSEGYYMFDGKGKLLKKKAVYYLNTTVNDVLFRGYYYTDSKGCFPAKASGLLKFSNIKCTSKSKTFNGYFYVQEYGKLSADAQVRKLSVKVNGVTFKGYYYFNSVGRLFTNKAFHKVEQKVGGVVFNGTYYFGGTRGVLVRKQGWVTYQGSRYYIDASGKMLTNCWKNGYYLLSNGKIAKSQQVPDGSYVDANGKKCKKEEVALSGLKNTLSSMTKKYGGTWSIYIKNLETGDVLNLNDRAMYPASTIKVFVMASLYNEIKAGRIKETSQVKSLLKSMITVSSNESYNALVKKQGSSGSFLSGAAVVNKYLKNNGYTSTRVHHTLHPASSKKASDGSSNTSSAKDCGVLLEKIYNGTCVSKAYSQKMLNLLLAQERRWKIPAGIPSGIKVANKTGETSTTDHDIAIVYGKKTDYVICVFSSGSSSSSSKIAAISKTVYNYLN
ncbi:MAG: serine hydrolase [Clostridiales bacterium]|nr:serine hydrolase [Clostridiales bacterium]